MATRRTVKRAWYVRLATWIATHVRVLVTWVIASGMAMACGQASYVNTKATVELGHTYGLTAAMLGAVPDLLMGLCLLGIGAKRRPGERASGWVWAGFIAGLLLSLASNEVAKWHMGMVGRAEGVVLPIVVMLSVEAVRNANKAVKRVKQNRPVKAPERAVQTSTVHLGTQGHTFPVTA